MIATRGEAGPRGGRHGRAERTRLTRLAACVVLVALATLAPLPAEAHPLGNFSISHYAAVRIEGDEVLLRYLIDMAEIPTFQEIQDTGIVAEMGHPSLPEYLARKRETLKEGLGLEVNGQRLALHADSSEVIFPPGAGGLPTLKLGVVYRATLHGVPVAGLSELRYRDANFPARAGWKEVVSGAGPGVTLVSSSVPERDRSRELADYPTDLLQSPPQDLEARVVFAREPMLAAAVRTESPGPTASPSTPTPMTEPPPARKPIPPRQVARSPIPPGSVTIEAAGRPEPLALQANQQGTPRNAFTELIATPERGLWMLLAALVVAAGLGAFHALEPGHGKTVVAAYLVGSRGTAWHATLLGLCVTASHTAGVYLLGGVTLYASRYIVPERLYPWLGVLSGLTITGLGALLFLRRYARSGSPHHHSHAHGRHDHDHSATHHHHHHGATDDPHAHRAGATHDHRHGGAVSLRELLALGVTGGIIPCPAALVVLLSAVSLGRVGFGLILIVAFSIGLAAVLIAVGILMVYARRLMSRWKGEGPLITRWLPLTSAALITVLGVGIALQAAVAGRILSIRL